MQLGHPIALAEVRQVLTVGRKAQVLGRGVVGGQLPRPATFHWGEPYVVLGDETHQVAVQGGVAEVGVITGAQHSRTLAASSYVHDAWRITIPPSEIKYPFAWSS